MALIGLILISTEAIAAIVKFAEADFVGSAMLVAVTVTIPCAGTLAGAIYRPLEEIVPHAAPVQPGPLAVHVTPKVEAPVTFPINC